MNKKQKKSASRILAFLLSFAMVVATFWSDYSLAFAAEGDSDAAVEQEVTVEDTREEEPAVTEEEPAEEIVQDEAVEDVVVDNDEEIVEEASFVEATDEDETDTATAESEETEVAAESDETDIADETSTEEIETETEETEETETETETEETELVEYTLYFEAGRGGFVSIEEQILTEEDEVETVTAFAYNGYRFVNWTKDGEEYSTSKSITPEPEDATYVANFEEEPKEFADSVTINGIKISLYAVPGVLPNDAKLVVDLLVNEEAQNVKDMVDEAVEEEVTATYSFDINIYSPFEGRNVQPEDGSVEVTFEAVPEAADDDTVMSVFHVDEDKNIVEQVSDETTSDSISFDTTHFSIYTVIVKTTGITNPSLKFSVVDWNFVKIGTDKEVQNNENLADTDGRYDPSAFAALVTVGRQYAFDHAEVLKDGYWYTVDYFRSDRDKDGYFYAYYDSGKTVACTRKNDNKGDPNVRFVYSNTSKDKMVIAIRNDGVAPAEPNIYAGGFYTFLGPNQERGSEVNITEYISSRDLDISKEVTYGEKTYTVRAVSGIDAVEARLTDKFYTLVASYKKPGYKGNGGYTLGQDEYIDWYVIKLQGNDSMWHIDGVIRTKSKYNLDYDNNAPAGTVCIGLRPDGKQYAVRQGESARATVEGKTAVESAGNGNKFISISGYEFLGWNTDKDATIARYAEGDTITFDKDTKLYAIWKKVTHKVIYKDYNNTVLQTTEGVEDGAADPELAEANKPVTREGYTLNDKSAWTRTVAANGDVTITLTYTVNKYKVIVYTKQKIYDSATDSYIETANSTQKVKDEERDYGSSLTDIAAPGIDGYTLKSTDPAQIPATVPVNGITITYTYEQDICKVTFKDTFKDANYQTVKKVVKGSTVAQITYGRTLTGYEFDAWYLGEVEYVFTSVVNNDITLNAKWTPIKYTIKYNLNGSDTDRSQQGSMADTLATYDTLPVTLSTNKFSRVDVDGITMTFKGWATEADSTQEKYKDGAKITVNLTDKKDAVVNLYAVWEKPASDVYFYLLLPNKQVPVDSSGQPITDYYPNKDKNSVGYYDWKGSAVSLDKIDRNLRDINGNIYHNEADRTRNNVSKYILKVPDSKINTYLSNDENYKGQNLSEANIVWYVYKNAGSDLHIDGYVKGADVTVTYYANYDGVTQGEGKSYVTRNVKTGEYTVEDYMLEKNKNGKFSYWTTQPDGGGEKYTTAQTFTLMTSVKLYAQWDREYTVIYTAGALKTAFENQTYVLTEEKLKVSDATPAFLVKNEKGEEVPGEPASVGDYNFAGWNPEVQDTVTCSITYTAQWEKKPTLKVTVNGGALDEKTVKYNGTAFELKPDVTVKIAPTGEAAAQPAAISDEEPLMEEDDADATANIIGKAIEKALNFGVMTAYAEEQYVDIAQKVLYNGTYYYVSGIKLTKCEEKTAGVYNVYLYTDGLKVQLNDKDGKDVTGRFIISADNNVLVGVLTIEKRQITLTADSASQVYNGNALTASGYTLSGDGFAKYEIEENGVVVDEVDEASYVNAFTSGSRTDVGTSENVMNMKVLDDFKDVIKDNYEIELVNGTLSVSAVPSTYEERDDSNDDDGDDDRADEAGSVLGANRGVDVNTNDEQVEEGQVLGAGRGKSPKTNDANNAVLWAMVMGTSALGIAAMMAQRRRREDEE